ncbi:TOBE domain-containing protein [Methylovulum psychrotolerans]|uniref:Molybdenum-dependent transcriptional regulator n=1 Tax=Methylovulum psychrotolerans TaxID=1704499 RepID=A0A2S5CHD5_9GAMM|nr:TOBE domain-containing protein [Methylovulum psychrotolerans]POZ50142.1 molybdenum-dependent transcriptional regulator [Methylovulum psychrotolerans]
MSNLPIKAELCETADSAATPAEPVALVSGQIHLLSSLGERLFGLLSAIGQTGSINQAARAVGLTYKGAWEMIERANNLSPNILVTTAIGGKQGGGTQLTLAGKAFLAVFQQLQSEHAIFLQQLNQRLNTHQDIVFLLKRLIMKASARNQFFGKVTDVAVGAVNATVTLDLKGGDVIVASVTKESVESLGIKSGLDAIALIKVSQVTLVTDFGGYRLSARNQLKGTVTRIQKGSVNTEVVIALQGGNAIAATITNESVDTLGLTEGSEATAVFKAGAVLLGVAS